MVKKKSVVGRKTALGRKIALGRETALERETVGKGTERVAQAQNLKQDQVAQVQGQNPLQVKSHHLEIVV